MTALNEAIFGMLQVAGMTAVVGSRVYPLLLPENPTYPAVRYQQLGGARESAMGSDVGLVEARVQIDSYAETYAGARVAAEAVRAAMQRVRGTVASVVISAVFLDEGPLDLYEEAVRKYRVQQDFIVWHRE